jgi:predicted anti-sigma-YlaC factor YlaD
VRNYAFKELGDSLAANSAGFATDEDPELIRGAAPFSLKLIESVLSEVPHHGGLLTAASSGFTQYAYAFVQQEAEELESRDVATARGLRRRARALYYRARDYGLRALDAKHAGFRAQFEASAKTALARLSTDDSAPLYWTIVAWTAAIALSKDSPKAIADLQPVDLMIERLSELDPDIDHGALHGFLITYEMGRPGARDAQVRARRHFEQAIRLSGGQKAGFFVAFAESVSVAMQNRREFVALLEQAIAIDPATRPEWRLENVVMQRRARWLLTQVDQLFLE